MAPAVAVENLFARETNLDRAARHHRQLRDDDLMLEGIALASEAAAARRGDDADVAGRKPQHLGQRAMEIVGVLRGTPQRQLAVGTELGDAGMLLQRKMRAALVESNILADEVGLGEARLDIAELVGLPPMDVAVFSVVMDARLGGIELLFDRANRFQR